MRSLRLSLKPSIIIGCLVWSASLVSAHGARAQSCPVDLSSLAGQIQTPDLQPLASTRIDDLVSRAVSLDQEIVSVSGTLDRFSHLQANFGNADDDATRQYVNDTVAILTAEIQALRCRKGA